MSIEHVECPGDLRISRTFTYHGKCYREVIGRLGDYCDNFKTMANIIRKVEQKLVEDAARDQKIETIQRKSINKLKERNARNNLRR